MKKIFFILLLSFAFLTSCNKEKVTQTFSFGEDLTFIQSGENFSVDLEKSSDLAKEKTKKIESIFDTTEKTKNVVAITASTANILDVVGIELIGAPESPTLNQDLKKKQYSLKDSGKVDKTKVLNIGSPISPNAEMILELEPSVVLYSDAMKMDKILDAIKKIGVVSEALPQSDYIDIFVLLDTLSKKGNDKAQNTLNSLVEDLKKAVKNVEENKNKDKKQTVAILQIAGNSILVNGDKSVLGRISNSLGMDNVFGETQNGELSKEQLLSLNPDFVIYYSMGKPTETFGQFEDELKDDNGIYRELSALKNNRVFPVKSEEFVFSSSVDLEIVKVINYLAGRFYEQK